MSRLVRKRQQLDVSTSSTRLHPSLAFTVGDRQRCRVRSHTCCAPLPSAPGTSLLPMLEDLCLSSQTNFKRRHRQAPRSCLWQKLARSLLQLHSSSFLCCHPTCTKSRDILIPPKLFSFVLVSSPPGRCHPICTTFCRNHCSNAPKTRSANRQAARRQRCTRPPPVRIQPMHRVPIHRR
jgi:hypothetical protein